MTDAGSYAQDVHVTSISHTICTHTHVLLYCTACYGLDVHTFEHHGTQYGCCTTLMLTMAKSAQPVTPQPNSVLTAHVEDCCIMIYPAGTTCLLTGLAYSVAGSK